MGGTFDPIHYGHLFAAQEAMTWLGLSKVVFVPSGAPPHKTYPDMATAKERYEMTLLAVADNKRFEISRVETDRPGMSYTLDTMKAMKELYPASELYFITGVDAAADMACWRAPTEIAALCMIAVVKRPGYDDGKLDDLPDGIKRSLCVIDAPMLDISATDIRRRAREGRGIGYLMPETVRAYIEKNSLYTSTGGESIDL
jgi:nicotinate-nucleotide adenylyltransferase